MRKLICLSALIATHWAFGQNVIWNEVVKSREGTERELYRINPEISKAEYLGEVEVQGFSADDAKVFGLIYKKAKEIGANSFSFRPFESVDGKKQKFDPWNYRISLYYMPSAEIPEEKGLLYIYAPPAQDQSVSLNNDKIKFKERTYTVRKLADGETYSLSTRKLLGSSVKLKADVNQPAQYLQLQAFQVQSAPYGEAGINLKSGDIIRLERSFADLLSVIYIQFK